jgi:hypothetical protein
MNERVWSIGGMIPTGETEVIGEKNHSRGNWIILYNTNRYSSVSIVTKLRTGRPTVISVKEYNFFLFVSESRWRRNSCVSISKGHLGLLPKAKVTRDVGINYSPVYSTLSALRRQAAMSVTLHVLTERCLIKRKENSIFITCAIYAFTASFAT